jgi:hypothetical protein
MKTYITLSSFQRTIFFGIIMPAWQRPTLPGCDHPSTIGAEELNFRVRDGNGCDLFAIITRYLEGLFLQN